MQRLAIALGHDRSYAASSTGDHLLEQHLLGALIGADAKRQAVL